MAFLETTMTHFWADSILLDNNSETPIKAVWPTFKASFTYDNPDEDKTHYWRIKVYIATVPSLADRVTYYCHTGTKVHAVAGGASGSTTHTFFAPTPLQPNTLYYYRAFIVDSGDNRISGTSDKIGSFWTDRPPEKPNTVTPASDSEFIASDNILFSWTYVEPDGEPQYEYRLQWRTAATPLVPAGAWHVRNEITATPSVVLPATTFPTNQLIEWQVQVRDFPAGPVNRVPAAWSPYSDIATFSVFGTTTAPLLISPINDESVVIDGLFTVVRFDWMFRSPISSMQQTADIRVREIGMAGWFTQPGDGSVPGGDWHENISSATFSPGKHYEWQVRTQDVEGEWSDWSQSATFWGIPVPGSGPVLIPQVTELAPALGCGQHRVFVYDRGGQQLRGEITSLASIMWSRKRDDISNSLLTTTGDLTEDCGALLAGLRSWIHEIVIERDGVRVWEGPVTRVTYGRDSVEIEAKDVMAYVYRRILRQGYNDAYRIVGGVQQGLKTVVYRAGRITQNALSYDDPNVLSYLTLIQRADDARQSRVVLPWSKTAWEEIDDLAATAGLDYTTVGRRIMFWDTHNQFATLSELRDGDFSESPLVTEYGMQMANVFGVTNNAGVWGAATRLDEDGRPKDGYPFVEQLASAYGETEGSALEEALTPEALAELQATLSDQASRNIASRYPAPLIVRVPDNTTLSPEVNIGINQLVPGVWIPLRAVGTLRQVTQYQKLDALQVTETGGKETVQVTLSPAPRSKDEDEDAGGEEV